MFEHRDNWIWIGLVASAALIGIAGEMWRRRALRRFVGEHVAASPRRNRNVVLGEVLAMLLLVGALADPRWGFRLEQVPESQTQLVFAVDVSRSMSAGDVAPSRLDAARALVTKCLSQLDGERVALVDFAGNARVAAPLTRNYSEIESKLAALRPSERLIGGSELKSAIQVGCDAFLHRMAGEKVLILLTDGEDHGSADAAQIASIATDCGCRTLIVGLGDPVAGSKIVVAQTADGPQYLTYKGETVVSRRNDALLEQLASLTGGIYVSTTSADTDLAAVYREHVTSKFADAHHNRQMRVGVARFPWFVGAALVVLLSALCLQRGGRPVRFRTSSAPHFLAAMLLLFVGLGASADDLIRAANRHFRAGRWEDALAGYEQAAALNAESFLPFYNQAMTFYRSGDRVAARRKLGEMSAADDSFSARRAFLLGNCDYADVVAGGLSKTDAIARLQSAIGNYREVLAVQPDWNDPRINIELAQMLIEEIKHAPESDQNSQESDKDNKNGNSENNNSPPQGSGQKPGPQPGGGNGNSSGQRSNSPSGKGGGSQNPPPGDGRNSGSRQPGNFAPDQSHPNDVQKKLENILRQSRQREAEQKSGQGSQRAQIDKDW